MTPAQKQQAIAFLQDATEPKFDTGAEVTCSVVERLLHAEGAQMPSVDAIYVRPNGLAFVMTGSDPSPDLYEACAEVACRIQTAIDTSGATYVEGGWRRNQPPIEGWVVAYSRDR